jgi:NAD(P)-dependent dehydrogenase (short-subunit alcohol dehydrogenase family)
MRVWFITGASRGFGSLIAQEALAAGEAVAATARNPKSITEHLGEHPNLLALALDVTQEAEARAAAAAAIERFGRIDVLINNAGLAYSARSRRRHPKRSPASTAPMSLAC